MMEAFLLTCVVSLSVLSAGLCSDDVILETLRTLTTDINFLKSSMSSLSTSVTNQIRLEAGAQIKSQMRDEMDSILEGRTLESVFQTSILSKMTKLEHRQQQLNRRLQSVVKALGDLQNAKEISDGTVEKMESDMLTLCGKRDSIPVRNRLMIASLDHGEFSQLDLLKNELICVPSPHGGTISALCYIASRRRLLLGVNNMGPEIVSVTLDGSNIQTLKRGYYTRGMAVDEVRGLVFVSVWNPRSLCRMSVTGKDWSTVGELSGYGDLRGIAVDSDRKEIYLSAGSRLIHVTYSGVVLQTLTTGHDFSYLYDVAFDSLNDVLYFAKDNRLMKMPVPGNVISKVITLDVTPWILSYHNNTLYYGGNQCTRYVGAVALGENVVNTRIQTLDSEYGHYTITCLIP